MFDKVARLGLKRESNFIYHVKDGDVWARPKIAPGRPRDPDRRVASVGVAMDPAYLYFLDDDGDVARMKRAVDGGSGTTPPLEVAAGTDHHEAKSIDHPVTEERLADFLPALGEEFCDALDPVVEFGRMCQQDGHEVWLRAFGRDPSPPQLAALTPAEYETLRNVCAKYVSCSAISLEHMRTWVARTLVRWPADEW